MLIRLVTNAELITRFQASSCLYAYRVLSTMLCLNLMLYLGLVESSMLMGAIKKYTKVLFL